MIQESSVFSDVANFLLGLQAIDMALSFLPEAQARAPALCKAQ